MLKLRPQPNRTTLRATAALLSLLLVAGCGNSAADKDGRNGPKGPAKVGYIIIQPGTAPVEQQLPARISAYQMSEVRPQVSGVIRRRLFQEGSIVQQGQTLYQIDPSLYQAQVSQASANVQSARATADAARARASRYKPLAEMEAVSKQDYTDALSQARQAEASIAQNNAALRTAQINLRYTRVPAPITGRIGLSSVTEGALVTANQTDPLTTITRLDPVYVDIQESAADLLALRRSLSAGGTVPTTASVRLKLPDGSDYGFSGVVEFSQVVVNQDTGTVTLRARFANPQSILLPGMFVTAQFAQAVNTTAFLVPQQAVTRDPKGNATLWIVGTGNRAVQRVVVADRTMGQYWVVTQGLAAGEKVITQGTANLRDGAPIKPVPASSAQKVGPAPKSPSGSR
ncbi:efflux RND transporter periplasmic adaptor subunit [Sphingomonas alba]|uniref:Efflux RND transporter periplasmic adaptor subunit n=1 Tax=Sphingomonas alba TaxID=2908208 RepID=A0ABT0RP18_9SPHN|nr:efflux RND transporter periplasmic adaptor subunit [Sphingomonas alba]MCL6684255.1 efflux RND transporter periplasmic adaptor subunit [Sphingomonas alba]